MALELKIPIPDQTTEEVRIVEWKINEGDMVKHGQVVLEIETDKAVMEVESPGDGTLLKALVEVDDMIPVGQVIGFIGEIGEELPVGDAPAAAVTETDKPAQTTKTPSAPVPAGVTEVKIPIADQTTEEVRIVSWSKEVGDAVKRGEVVLEIETDKAVMEVESPADGTLLGQFVAVDDMVPVGQVIAMVGPAGVVVSDAPKQTAAPSAPVQTAPSKTVKATPLARKIAAKTGINLDSVAGSGHAGKVVRNDVESYTPAGQTPGGRLLASPNAKRLASELGVDIALVTGTGPNGRILGPDVTQYAQTAPTAAVATAAAGQPQPGTETMLTKMRRAIGINLQTSFRDTPHFNVTMSIDMTRAMAFRTKLNEGKQKKDKVSVNDLVLTACARGLKQFPAMNSRFADDRIQYMSEINIGVATTVETGLIVPVVTNTDTLSFSELAAETKRIVASARG
ncbi:MAG: 2-oxo acid dehydrogenase subunit E2, partial [Anaerohalosphaera sp.]|nr:2-oxo acid dehydrogenase subunit E2 [Anaerohalosphaera sp.]